MVFFNKNLVDQFMVDYGSTVKLYILSDLFTLFKIKKKSYRTFLAEIIKDSCAGNIGDGYRNDLSIKFIIRNPENYDFIAVASSEIDIDEEKQLKYNKIQGFMIVQRGECQTYPDNYCVNLICTKSSVGNILMALYIYIIIQNDDFVNKIGLLELANAYINAGGLCLYAKYGFKFDPNLSNNTCFPYFTPNLPMIANIEEYGESKEDKISRLLSILKTGSRSFDKPSICSVRGIKQKLLGFVLNLQLSNYVDKSLKMGETNDKDQDEYLYGIYNNPHKVPEGNIDYKILLEKIESEYGGVDNFIDRGINDINDDQASELVNLVFKPQSQEVKAVVPPVIGEKRTSERIISQEVEKTDSDSDTKKQEQRSKKQKQKQRSKLENFSFTPSMFLNGKTKKEEEERLKSKRTTRSGRILGNGSGGKRQYRCKNISKKYKSVKQKNSKRKTRRKNKKIGRI
jgi:hypothetical protein